MKRAPWFAIVAMIAASCGSEPSASPSVAVPKDAEWLKTHEAFLQRARQGKVDLLFLGDSITAWWFSSNGEGKGAIEVWKRYYAPKHAANFGIPGDRVENLLWRIENGEVDGIKPKAVVVLIGTNNVMIDTPAEIAEGIGKVVKRLRAKLPETKILLLGIFPRSERQDMVRERNRAVNERISRLDDGRFIFYQDLESKFIEPDGSIRREIMPDSLHLSKRGYEIWAEAMEPTLRELLGEQ